MAFLKDFRLCVGITNGLKELLKWRHQMAKYQYSCRCNGFTLSRGAKTREQYANIKKEHAKACELLKKELEQSASAASKGNMHKPS
jgi:hypothetical protein